MKNIINNITIILFFLIGTITYSQNYAGFYPTTQSISTDSKELVSARIRVNGYGSSPDAIFLSLIPNDIDEGYQGYEFTNTIIFVGGVEYLDIFFKKNVTSRSVKTYKFIVYSNFSQQNITVNVTYNPVEDEICNLSSPSSLYTTNITDSGAKLDWSAVSGNSGYQYAYRKSTTSSWTTGTTTNSYVNRSS